MDTARIAELLAPFLRDRRGRNERARVEDAATLSPQQLESISTYIDILLRWNERINLTAVREPEQIVARHFGESLFAARQLFPDPSVGTAAHLTDVGSGAGFPGLPIKIWAPKLRLTLIEANQKKAVFLREVVRTLGLREVDVLSARAELQTEKADVVTVRAVEHFDSILPIAAGLTRPAGRLAILIGNSQADRLRALVPGMKWSEPVIMPLSQQRVLITGRYESW